MQKNKNTLGNSTLEDLGNIINSISIANALIYRNPQGIEKVFITTNEENPCRLVIFNLGSEQVENIIALGDSVQAWGLVQDEKGSIFIGTRNANKKAGIYRYNILSGKLDLIVVIDTESLVWSLSLYENSIFIGTYPSAKIFCYDLSTNKLKLLVKVDSETSIRCLSVGTNKILYGGTGNNAFFMKHDLGTGETKRILLEGLQGEAFVYSVLAYKNKIFIGTQPNGRLIVLSEKDLSVDYQVDTGETTIEAISIAGDPNKVYFTTRPEGGLFEYDLILKKAKKIFVPMYHHQARFLGMASNGLIGVTSNGFIWKYDYFDGLKVYDLEKKGVLGLSGKMYSMQEGEDGNIYIGAHRSCYVFNPQDRRVSHFWVPGQIQSMGQDNNYIFFGIYEGAEIWKFNPKDKIFKDAKESNPSLFNIIGYGQSRPMGPMQRYRNKLIMATNPFPGQLNAAVSIFDNKKIIKVYRIENRNIYSMSVCGNKLIIGVSSIGEGIQNINEDARIIIIDLKKFTEVYSFVPAIGEKIIYAMTCNKDTIYGLTREHIFAYSLIKNENNVVAELPYKTEYFSSNSRPNLITKRDGKIYGTNGNCFFELDIFNKKANLIIKGETGYLVEGKDGCIYLNIGSRLLKFKPS